MAVSAENRRVKFTLSESIPLYLRTRLCNRPIRFDTTKDSPYGLCLLDLKANGFAEIWNEAVLPWMALAAFFMR